MKTSSLLALTSDSRKVLFFSSMIAFISFCVIFGVSSLYVRSPTDGRIANIGEILNSDLKFSSDNIAVPNRVSATAFDEKPKIKKVIEGFDESHIGPFAGSQVKSSTNISIDDPVMLFTLHPDLLMAGNGIESAKTNKIGMYYYGVESFGDIIGGVKVDLGNDGILVFDGISWGEGYKNAVKKIRDIRSNPELSKAYEARLLIYPLPPIDAIWLRSLSGSPDIVLPFNPIPNDIELVADKTYTTKEYCDIIVNWIRMRATR